MHVISITERVTKMSVTNSPSDQGAAATAVPWAQHHHMTIEELAAQVGMTVRNVRAYNSAGLLAPPTLRGRLGLYGEEHLAQLQVIRTLRNQGISLERIKALVRQGGDSDRIGSWHRLGELAQTLAWHIPSDAPPQQQPVADIEALWRHPFTPALAESMMRSGLQRMLADGMVEHLSPGLRPVGVRMATLGLPLPTVLAAQEALSRDLRQAVRNHLRLMLSALMQPADSTSPSPAPRVSEAELIRQIPDLLMQAVQHMLPVLLQQETQRLSGMAGLANGAGAGATAAAWPQGKGHSLAQGPAE